MDFATTEDVIRIERKIDELKELILIKPIIKSISMTIAEVTAEFNCSAHTQRLARNKGDIAYRIEGYKEIKYNRIDVEAWLERKTIKSL